MDTQPQALEQKIKALEKLLEPESSSPPKILESALQYIQQNRWILPLHGIVPGGGCSCRASKCCTSPGKHPRTRRGLKDASRLASSARQWFQDEHCNIGILTGEKSNLVVVDVDCNRGGSVDALWEYLGDVIRTYTVKTGNGWHLYYAHPGRLVRNAVDFIRGVDIRGDGGYIVAPPSRHVSGVCYRVTDQSPPVPLPARLLGDATQRRQVSARRCGSIAPVPPEPSLQKSAGVKKDAESNGKAIREGTRNATLASIAGCLRHHRLSCFEIEASIEAINQICCSVPLPSDEIRKIAKSISRYPAPEPWPEPRPYQDLGYNKLAALRPHHLPDPLADWLTDISERMQVPLEYVSGPAIVALGSAIGRRIYVAPRALDDWMTPPNLWGMLIAEPGSKKSPALAQALAPLASLSREARCRYENQMAEYEREKEHLDLQISALRDKITRGGKGNYTEEFLRLRDQSRGLEKPICRRYQTNDATVERLGAMLAENPSGLLLYRDELSGWLEILGRSGARGDREFFLETWNGDSPMMVDRMSREMHAEAMCLSIFGAIQPTKISKYLKAYKKNGGDDGLMERFQLTFFPNRCPEIAWVDRKPNQNAAERVLCLFKRLAAMPADQKKVLRFSGPAQVMADEWEHALNQEVAGRALSPVMRGHLGKYRSLMPSLALIFWVCASKSFGAKASIDFEHVERAITWCDILRTHAEKVYLTFLGGGRSGVETLVERIRAGRVRSGMKLRELARMQWTHLTTADEVQSACEILCELGWLRIQTSQGGQPSRLIELNPKLPKHLEKKP